MPTEQKLRDLTPHLTYEVKMLLWTDLLLHREARGASPPDRENHNVWTIHNALVESLTIHARILYAFFFQGRAKPGDAIASDYVPNWTRLRPRASKLLQRVPTRVGFEIAHLSFGRLAHKTEEDRRWPFWAIADELIAVLNVWLTHAPDYAREELLKPAAAYHAERNHLDPPESL